MDGRGWARTKVSVETGRLVGVEALVRWNHPRRGQIPPSNFIPIAEESGAIVPLGRWVPRQACAQMERWRSSRRAAVAVNVSARQLRDPQFVSDVSAILKESGLAPAFLVLEITETAMMQDVAATISTLTRLKRLGLRLSIDDFGTGYASLSHLRQFPFDELKIDKSFIDSIGVDAGNLTSAIVSIGRKLKLEIVAEGVESQAQMDDLRELGCDVAQRYLFSRPLPASQIDALLEGPPKATAA